MLVPVGITPEGLEQIRTVGEGDIWVVGTNVEWNDAVVVAGGTTVIRDPQGAGKRIKGRFLK